jgi:hypothetical protein
LFCSNCGAAVHPGTNCTKCGFGDTVSPSAPPPLPEAVLRKSKRRTIKWLVAIPIAGLLLSGLYGGIKGFIHPERYLSDKNTFDSSNTDRTKREFPQLLEDSDVAIVKDGVLPEPYNTTTVGKAFEGTFENPKWKSFVSPKGTTIVEFDGTIKPNTLVKSGLYIPEGNQAAERTITHCMDNLNLTDAMTQEAHRGDYWRLSVVFWLLHTRPETFDSLNECVNLPITFQFALSADKKTFTFAYVDEMLSNQAEKTMDFIYH